MTRLMRHLYCMVWYDTALFNLNVSFCFPSAPPRSRFLWTEWYETMMLPVQTKGWSERIVVNYSQLQFMATAIHILSTFLCLVLIKECIKCLIWEDITVVLRAVAMAISCGPFWVQCAGHKRCAGGPLGVRFQLNDGTCFHSSCTLYKAVKAH